MSFLDHLKVLLKGVKGGVEVLDVGSQNVMAIDRIVEVFRKAFNRDCFVANFAVGGSNCMDRRGRAFVHSGVFR